MSGSSLDKINPNYLLVAGMLIFLLNMGFVWYAHFSSLSYIQGTFLDSGQKTNQVQNLAKELDECDANSIALIQRVIEAEIHLKSITNNQSMLTVCIGMAFGLIAVGCGLFVLGVQGGFEAEAQSPQGGSVVLKSSMPGVLCFALGTLIIVMAFQNPAKISFGAFTLEPTAKYRMGTSKTAMPPKTAQEGPETNYGDLIFNSSSSTPEPSSTNDDETSGPEKEIEDETDAGRTGVTSDTTISEPR